jgi:tetratricopeptide (TPR) repeat protein
MWWILPGSEFALWKECKNETTKETPVMTNTPTQQLSWLIELAEQQKKSSQFGTLHNLLKDIESELHKSEGEFDDHLFCEAALYLAKSFEDLGYVGKAMEYYEQASLFAPEVSVVEEKALAREIRLKAFLRLNQDLEPSYIYLKSFDQEDDFQYLSSVGFAELSLGRKDEASKYFEKALNLKKATEEETRHLFFQLLEQEIFHGHDFSRIVKLSQLTMFKNLTAYEQTLIFVLTQDTHAMHFLGTAWFAKMSPAECIKAAFLLSHAKDFKYSWTFRPVFYQNLSQFDFLTQTLWKGFFEKSGIAPKVTAS